MRTIDLETAIAEFLSLGQRLESEQPITGERVLDLFIPWYRDTRVTNAALDNDGDMLLLQWGAGRKVEWVPQADGKGKFVKADKAVPYLDFTRQVFAPKDAEEEFDDSAIQMSLTLRFEPTTDEDPGSNLWIGSPDGIEDGLARFRVVPFVRSFLSVPTRTIVIQSGRCG